ncbi:proline dehydrogenase 2, mitochondrial-like [Humulus lupulus]|uniref:proline dehydrogenase 2, mitochondrial-like n=1 Tax=Humulus lupulus TaxID=3486 RepID=UPI002B40EB3C|nr:proline dehydrogenase 2, mitochondrial-like [Humulus lupulus]
MASRVPRGNLSKSLRHFTRPLNSAASSSAFSSPAVPPLNFAEKSDTSVVEEFQTGGPGVFDVYNTQKLFSSIPTTRLLRASANIHVAAIESVVDLGMWLMKSKLMETELVRNVVMETIRHTFFEHFCAGEDTAAAGQTILKLREAGLRGMLVYALEYATDNESCDRNLEGFLRTVESTKSLPPSSASFIIVKISAICPMAVLERASDLLRWHHKDPSFNLPWKLDSLPIFADSSPMYHTLKKPEPLTLEEERDLHLGYERLLKLCQKCTEANVPLSVDAEHTSVQPILDYLTYASAVVYNKNDRPIVYGTIQAYLKDAKDRLLLAAKAAEDMGIQMGFKVVRGAYMSTETKIASSLGYESPIHNNIQDTHDCYNDCASFMLEKIANGSCALVLASHNVESGRLAAAKAHDLGIGKLNHRLEFAQLYGMAESLSFGLRNAGFQVSKYMPFGPIDMVMPYLLRRAEENRGLLSASSLDRHLMRTELKRRLKAAIVGA